MRTEGTGAALDQLEAMAAADRNTLAMAHNFVHALGRASFEHYGRNAQVAFSQCRETFESGCYHGVLEAFLSSKTQVTAEDLAGLCDATVDPRAPIGMRFQCVHGLGHGLSMYFNHDLLAALQHCDYLKTDWDRISCHGGAFMENIIFAREEANPAHSHGGPAHRSYTTRDDLLYPCSALADRYLSECYIMQSSIILFFNGQDYAGGFRACDGAPEKWIGQCYQSMGRDISGATLRDEAESLRLCGLGQDTYAAYCYMGAVKNVIGVDWKTDGAFSFCSKVPAKSQDMCYEAIGQQIHAFFAEVGSRSAECAKAGADRFVSVCRQAAYLE
jgi:hypothetical protein